MSLSATITDLTQALDDAFVAGMEAMAAKSNKIDGSDGVSPNSIYEAWGDAFKAIAAPAIKTFVESGVVNTAVTTTGSAAAQAGVGVGAVS